MIPPSGSNIPGSLHKTQWTLNVEGMESGPYSSEHILEMLDKGEITPQNRVTCEELAGEWISVRELSEAARRVDSWVQQAKLKRLEPMLSETQPEDGAQNPDPDVTHILEPNKPREPASPIKTTKPRATTNPLEPVGTLAPVDTLFDAFQAAKQVSKKKLSETATDAPPLYAGAATAEGSKTWVWALIIALTAGTAVAAWIVNAYWKKSDAQSTLTREEPVHTAPVQSVPSVTHPAAPPAHARTPPAVSRPSTPPRVAPQVAIPGRFQAPAQRSTPQRAVRPFQNRPQVQIQTPSRDEPRRDEREREIDERDRREEYEEAGRGPEPGLMVPARSGINVMPGVDSRQDSEYREERRDEEMMRNEEMREEQIRRSDDPNEP